MENFRNGIIRAAALCSALTCSLLAGAVQVVVSPTSQSIARGATAQFAAAVSGAADSTLAWSVNGVSSGNSTVGTIGGTGLYASPLAFPSPTTVTVTATSNADPTASGSASLQLHNPVPVLSSITPSAFPLGPFNITINGKSFLSGAKVIFGGAVVATQWVSSTQVLATGSATASGSIPVRVSNGDPGPSTSTPLYVQVGSSSPPGTITVTVSPSNSTVQTGAAKQFSATVTNANNLAVTWSASVGSINNTGLYTALVAVPSPAAVTVTATSAADTTKSGSTSLTITPPPPPVTPTISFVNPATISVGAFGFRSAAADFPTRRWSASAARRSQQLMYRPNQLSATGSATAAQAGQVPVIVANAGPTNSTAYNVTVNNGQTLASQTASRFLQQAAFGPSPASVSHVQQVGLQPYLSEQFAMPQASNYHVSGSWVPSVMRRK